jgi:hypothetical protein
MLFVRNVLSAVSASLLFACGHAAPSPPARAPAPPPLLESYRVIEPEVSLSRTAQAAVPREPAPGPDADVMAEILSIPPGR